MAREGSIAIVAAEGKDFAAIWAMLEATIRAGETFALPREMTRDDALAYWFAPGNHVFAARVGAVTAGSFFVRANAAGGGGHVANAGFVTAPTLRNRGVARAMGEHALAVARRLEFTAMQFNFVVSSNEAAVHLWKSLGFGVAGTLPRAFKMPSGEACDVFVMYREL